MTHRYTEDLPAPEMLEEEEEEEEERA